MVVPIAAWPASMYAASNAPAETPYTASKRCANPRCSSAVTAPAEMTPRMQPPSTTNATRWSSSAPARRARSTSMGVGFIRMKPTDARVARSRGPRGPQRASSASRLADAEALAVQRRCPASRGAAPGRRAGRREPLELALEPRVTNLAHLERQPDARRRRLRRAFGGRRAPLRQPYHASVEAEVEVAQLGMAIEAELAHDRVLEGAREEVGEEVRARLGGHRLGHLLAREDVVAVLSAQALEAELVERAVGPAVAIAEHDAVVA